MEANKEFTIFCFAPKTFLEASHDDTLHCKAPK